MQMLQVINNKIDAFQNKTENMFVDMQVSIIALRKELKCRNTTVPTSIFWTFEIPIATMNDLMAFEEAIANSLEKFEEVVYFEYLYRLN